MLIFLLLCSLLSGPDYLVAVPAAGDVYLIQNGDSVDLTEHGRAAQIYIQEAYSRPVSMLQIHEPGHLIRQRHHHHNTRWYMLGDPWEYGQLRPGTYTLQIFYHSGDCRRITFTCYER